MTIAVDLGRKATKQTYKTNNALNNGAQIWFIKGTMWTVQDASSLPQPLDRETNPPPGHPP